LTKRWGERQTGSRAGNIKAGKKSKEGEAKVQTREDKKKSEKLIVAVENEKVGKQLQQERAMKV